MGSDQELPAELGGGGAPCLPTELAFTEIRLECGAFDTKHYPNSDTKFITLKSLKS